MNNILRDAFTGGACNTNDSQAQQRNANPFTGFLDQVFLGRAQNREKLEGFQPGEEGYDLENELKERQMEFRAFDKEWIAAAQEHKQMQEKERLMMEEQWRLEEMNHIEMLKKQELERDMAWKDAELQHKAEEWGQNFEMQQAFEEAKNEERQKDPGFEQATIKQAANDIMEVMARDPDPKFQNSKFFQFMKKLQTGEYKIENNELIVQEGPALETEFNKAYEESTQKITKEMENLKMEEAWARAQQEGWTEAQQNEEHKMGEDIDEKNFNDYLDAEYKKILEELEKTGGEKYKDLFSESWQKASDMEEHELYRDASDKYWFAQTNPFMEDAKPLHTAIDLIAKGRAADAILAMEAHLQKNPDDNQTWRILGRLHQENDNDQKAVSCLLNALKIEPTNLDTLLALGISCTNILDEVKAMNFLKLWLMNNKNYQDIKIDPGIVPENRIYDEYKIDEIKDMNKAMLAVFQQARAMRPDDPELLTSLSVLHFIAREYESSVQLFQDAVKFDPSNYSLWNKLGATLAHLGRADEAVEAYYRALELKPNYVRVWVNLGIAQAYKGNYEEAARFYLNALSLNSDAKHVWTYLQTCFTCLGRFDLIPKIRDQRVDAFLNEFEIIRTEDLPQPEIDYESANRNFVIKEDVKNWVNDFIGGDK